MLKKIIFWVFLILLAISGCRPDKTRNSASLYLKNKNILDSFPTNWTMNLQGIDYYKRLINSTSDSSKKFELQINLANQYIFAGQNDSCIQLIKYMMSQKASLDTNSAQAVVYYKLLALAFFRNGEVLNCQLNGNEVSCLLPLSSRAIYRNKEATQKALYYYTKILKQQKSDYVSRWMLNICYATIGLYPDSVPREYFINFGKYDAFASLQPFSNIASGLGVATLGFYGGSNMEDFNNDGLIDLFCCSFHMNDPVHLYINDGKGGFTDETKKAGLQKIFGGVFSTHVDYDNDGFVDILIIRGGWLQQSGVQPCTLLHNNGDGTFTDVTDSAGLNQHSPSHSACWADVNNDGLIDLFIAHEKWNENTSQPSQLFLNNGNGTFREASEDCGVLVDAYVKGCVFGDINNDGKPDLYVSIYGGPNLLFLNEGVSQKGFPHFVEIAAKAGVQQPIFSFPCAIFDYDNDGWDDILCTGYNYSNYQIAIEYVNDSAILYPPKLYHNNHDNTFTDVTAKVGLNRSIYAMGLNFADIDNDGYLDFYVATGGPDYQFLIPNLMFRNNNGKGFQDVTKITATGHLQKGHSVSFGDIDNDGSTDLYLEVGGLYCGDQSRNVLFYNNNRNNNWIGLNLVGVKSNRSAIGARVKVVVSEPSGEERSIYKTVSTGASYGANSLEMNIGIAQSDSINRIEITWARDKYIQTFHNIVKNHFYKIVEGQASAQLIEKKQIPFKSKYPAGVICK